MLYIENEEVKITSEGMTFPATIDLYKKDRRNESKPFFKKCITYVYYAYSPDSSLKLVLPSKRKQLAAEIAEVDYNELESDDKIQAFIKFYREINFSPTELLYENAKRRVDETIEWLNSIPIKKTDKQKVSVSYINPGTKETENTYVSVVVEIDNSDEVKKAIQMSNLLADQLEELRKKIVKEAKTTKAETRLFDTINTPKYGR